MTHKVDLYWSFRSPYSYLATSRIVDLARTWDLEVNVRPVYPLAVRTPDFFKKVNPLLVSYIRRDTRRIAEWLNIPYRWPNPDPIVMDMETFEIPAEQPYIYRLTHLGVEAARRGHGLAFVDEVSRLIWNGATDGWNTGKRLSDAAARAGLDLAELDAAISNGTGDHADTVSANQDALTAAGHWGVPTLVVEDEPFFGQDRIDLALWRLQQLGLKRR